MTTVKLDLPKQLSILEEAEKLINGDRQQSYGHPYDDYQVTAAMWRAMMIRRYGIDVPLTPDFACLMMAAMKISREAGQHKRDNLVDMAGYAGCVEKCLVRASTPKPTA